MQYETAHWLTHSCSSRYLGGLAGVFCHSDAYKRGVIEMDDRKCRIEEELKLELHSLLLACTVMLPLAASIAAVATHPLDVSKV